jgi:Effector Associated Constant Component 1
MDLTIAMSGPDPAGELRSLYAWLADDEELRGLVRLDTAAPAAGTLGSAAELLAVALGPGGVSAAVATGLVAWLRQRTSDVAITARGRDGREVRLAARRVRALDSGQLRELSVRVAAELDQPAAGDDG